MMFVYESLLIINQCLDILEPHQRLRLQLAVNSFTLNTCSTSYDINSYVESALQSSVIHCSIFQEHEHTFSSWWWWKTIPFLTPPLCVCAHFEW